jgi:nucleoside-diphosphate-sugar epimerase
MSSIKNVLLTGATGFLGSHLLRKLVEENYNVVFIKRFSSPLWRIADCVDKAVAYDTEEDISYEEILNKHSIEAIIHTATNYDQNADFNTLLETNLLFPVKLLDAAQKSNVKIFINTDTFFTKNSNYTYLSRYTASKTVLKTLLQQYSTPAIINLQLEHIFGEDDSDSKFVTSIINQLVKNEKQINLTTGLQKRDFIYVGDVVDAFLKVLEQHDQFQGFSNFEIGRGASLSIRKFAEMAHEITGSTSSLNFGAIESRKGEFEESVADGRFANETGWKPATEIDIAIKNIVTSLRKKVLGSSN